MSLFPLILCFFASLLLCPLLVRISPLIGGMDFPDGARKLHARPTPRIGGAAFFFSFFLSVLLFLPPKKETLALLAFGLLPIFSGFLDDTRTLCAGKKLFFQILAAGGVLAVCGVPRAVSLFSRTIPLPAPLSFLLFSIYIVAAINAMNFVDGADGLAAGCALPSLLGLSLLFFLHGDGVSAATPLLLFFALLGFLPFNRSPARLFMGDEGSQFLGFALACFSLTGGVFSLSRVLFLALPFFDLVSTVLGRIVRHKSPFLADRSHLHHRLTARGFSPSEVLFFAVALSYSASMLGAMCALL